MNYGKEIIREEVKSIVNGTVKSVRRYEEHSVLIDKQSDLMAEILLVLSKLDKGETLEAVIKLYADPTTHRVKRMERGTFKTEQTA